MRVMPDSMSPLRFLLLTITALLTFTLFLPAFGPLSPSTLRAEEPSLEQQRLDFEVQKLKLEVEELGKPWWHKVGHLVPVIVPSVTLLVLGAGAFWTIFDGRRRRRLETITNLKREFASDNPAIRIAAVHALADYPKEAIPTLIASLGSTKGGHSQVEEDTAFTSAVKDSLRQIGKEAVYPLIRELRRIQGEIRGILISDEDMQVTQLCGGLPFVMLLSGRLEDVRNMLKTVAEQEDIELDDGVIDRAVEKLNSIRSSKPEEIIAHKNCVETLAYLLRTYKIKRLRLDGIDLSYAYLLRANLSGASLSGANLSGANLEMADLSGAYLWGATLSDANLRWANLSGADLGWANLSGANLRWANLSGANLRGANLAEVEGFRKVKDFSKADLRGVKGLSREDLGYAKSKGAIIDEPATKPKEPAE